MGTKPGDLPGIQPTLIDEQAATSAAASGSTLPGYAPAIGMRHLRHRPARERAEVSHGIADRHQRVGGYVLGQAEHGLDFVLAAADAASSNRMQPGTADAGSACAAGATRFRPSQRVFSERATFLLHCCPRIAGQQFDFPRQQSERAMTLAKRPLTERMIQSLAPAPKGKRFILWDGLVPGFGVRVSDNGSRSYVLVTRYPGHVHPTARAIGTVGKVTLEWARARAREWYQSIAEGNDPGVQQSETFAAIAEDYFTREGSKLRTADERQRLLDRAILPALGAKPISKIKRSEIISLLDSIEDERGPEASHKVLGLISKIMGWHASRSDNFVSPIVRGMGRSQHVSRQRVLSDEELRAVWGACEGVFGSFVKFLLLTAVRRNEAAGMKRDEIVGEDWIIPASRYKTGLELVVPLSGAARRVLEGMPVLGEYIFTTSGRAPISGFSKFKADLDQASGVSDWTLHDLRRSARSLMSRAGVSNEVGERCLGHVLGGIVKTYNRYSYAEEKRIAFGKLAMLVEGIVSPQPNVLPMVRA
jgi:integrase